VVSSELEVVSSELAVFLSVLPFVPHPYSSLVFSLF
jgi:hypothetical protein